MPGYRDVNLSGVLLLTASDLEDSCLYYGSLHHDCYKTLRNGAAVVIRKSPSYKRLMSYLKHG